MRALRFHGREDLRLDTIPTDECGPHDVRIKVGYCGICGSDIHEYLGGPILAPQHGEKHPYNGAELPVTMGHEMAGTITEVGKDVKDYSTGQKVAVIPAMDDRHYGLDPCDMCSRGKVNLCKRTAYYGLSAHVGGFADEIVVNHHAVLPLPDGMSLKLGALCEPIAVAWHMVRVAGMVEGDNCVVLGAGPIGLALLLVLKAKKARKIIVSEVTASRAEAAKQFGADLVVNPLESDNTSGDPVVKAAHDLMGEGADISFDASGIQATLNTAIACVRPAGTVFNVAIHEKPLSINLNDLTMTEKKLTGGICYTREDFEGASQLVAGNSEEAEKMITSITALDDIVKGGFLELINNKANHVKILIEINKE
ncbi:hypothetical protein LTR37_002132 [Vermiconidia calcicola]|uniref:Uncharacterized protein n=1 Tax=Vermiconidia calcicola TaxID=1690605 RepID=A0ACC3NWJ2_9PEZI|nr:hypothetical protein LTR37_002132 [Vermiconidia calcicola]